MDRITYRFSKCEQALSLLHSIGQWLSPVSISNKGDCDINPIVSSASGPGTGGYDKLPFTRHGRGQTVMVIILEQILQPLFPVIIAMLVLLSEDTTTTSLSHHSCSSKNFYSLWETMNMQEIYHDEESSKRNERNTMIANNDKINELLDDLVISLQEACQSIQALAI
jgi:hypothetical protein